MEIASNTNLTAEEMILANGAAEAREAERLRDTADRYAEEIAELKALYDKNSALVEELRELNAQSVRGVQDVCKSTLESIDAANASVKDIDFSALQKAIIDSVQESQTRTADLLQQSDDFSHKENVRVYRNIQAATDQLLQKQTEQLTEALEPLKTPARPQVSKVQVATLIVALLGVAIEVLDILGVFAQFTL